MSKATAAKATAPPEIQERKERVLQACRLFRDCEKVTDEIQELEDRRKAIRLKISELDLSDCRPGFYVLGHAVYRLSTDRKLEHIHVESAEPEHDVSKLVWEQGFMAKKEDS